MPRLLPPLIVVLVAVGLYWPSIFFDFVWDDFALFIHSAALRADQLSWAALARPILPDTTYFRPLVLLSFYLQFKLNGVTPVAAHATNLLIYLANALLVYSLAAAHYRRRRLESQTLRATLAAIAYAAHPALIESTAWISGRFDLLATFFCLATLLVDLRLERSLRRELALGTLFLLGLACKEVAVVLPVLVLLQRIALVATNQPASSGAAFARNNLLSIAIFACFFAVYLLVRISAVHHLLHVNKELDAATAELPTHLALITRALSFYGQLALAPFAMVNPLHPLDPELLLDWQAVPEIAITLAALAVVLIGALRLNFTALMLVSGLVALMPVLHIVPLTIGLNIGCDRFLTLPLAMMLIGVLAIDPASLPVRRAPVAAIAVVSIWIAMSLASSASTIPLWQSDFSVRLWTYSRHPDFHQARSMYLSELMSSDRFALAKPVFEQMLAEGPLNADDQFLYGDYLSRSGNPAEGIEYIRGALLAFPPLHTMSNAERASLGVSESIKSREGYGYYALANAYLKARQYQQADAAADAATWYLKDAPRIWVLKSITLGALGHWQDADELFEKTVRLLIAPDARTARRIRADAKATYCHEHATDSACRAN